MPLAVIMAAIAACVAGIRNQFTQDDLTLLQYSDRLEGLSHWTEILTSPYWPPPFPPDLYRPVTSLLLAVEITLGAGAPLVFRLFSYALYAAACVGVLRLASRLCPPVVAFGVAMLFAAHPVHVEAVALAVGQAELLVAVFATAMVTRYLDRRRQGRLRASDWAALIAMYVVAAFTKENALVLPALLLLAELLLVDDTPLAARVRALWKGYACLAIAGAAVLLVRVAVLHNALGADTAQAIAGLTVQDRLLTMLKVVPEWVRLLAWPAHLRADYSPAEFSASQSFGFSEALGLAIVAAAVVICWLARRRISVVSFGVGWCIVALLPVSNVIVPTGILIAERTLFLPSAGFVIALGGAVTYALERVTAPDAKNVSGSLLAVACAALVVAGIGRSAVRQLVWRDTRALTLATIRDAPRSWRSQQAYGEVLFDQGRWDDAARWYHSAIQLCPEPWLVRNRFAQRLRWLGREGEAVAQLRLSLAERPSQIEPIPELAAALLSLGRYDEARRFADSIIVVAHAPPIMLWLRHVADSAIAIGAPAGSIKVGIRSQ